MATVTILSDFRAQENKLFQGPENLNVHLGQERQGLEGRVPLTALTWGPLLSLQPIPLAQT